ncbi:MAG: 3-deoxy-D-manno-octulosonic acid transferase, partial [Deltaproteobacteria bacterium]|nr:3-deoxy-D-manno-octulosonic acid transferase [Deltaproteobacteria bacterium]
MTPVLLFLYDLLGVFVSLCLLPLGPWLKEDPLAERLGLFLPPERSGKRPIWVHALSVGEVLSALPLVLALKGRYPRTPV